MTEGCNCWDEPQLCTLCLYRSKRIIIPRELCQLFTTEDVIHCVLQASVLSISRSALESGWEAKCQNLPIIVSYLRCQSWEWTLKGCRSLSGYLYRQRQKDIQKVTQISDNVGCFHKLTTSLNHWETSKAGSWLMPVLMGINSSFSTHTS